MVSKRKDETFLGFLYLSPSLILLAIFCIFPVYRSIIYSFQKINLLNLDGAWVGFKNYQYLFRNKDLLSAAMNGFIWMFGTVSLQVILGVSMALILNKKFFARGIVRVIVMLPFFLPGVSMALTWRWMYYDFNGIINHTLMLLHIIDEPILWLSSMNLAMFSVIIQSVWKFTPFVVINCLARISVIEKSLYECAELDGASKSQIFFKITLPQLKGVLTIVVLLRGIWMFNKFSEIHLMTGGGPAGATTTLPILAHNMAFGAMRIGEGAAVNNFIFIILIIIATIYLSVFNPTETGEM